MFDFFYMYHDYTPNTPIFARMFRKKIIFFLICILFSFNGFSIKPHPIDTSEIIKQLKKIGVYENIINKSSFNSTFFSSIVYKNDSTIFYNPNNTLYLFKIYLGDIPQVSMVSNQVQFGLTNNRHLFIYNDIIYSYGGDGFLNSFSGLIYFDDLTGLWLKKEINDYPFDSKKVLNSWKIGDKIMVLLNHFSEFEKTNSVVHSKFSFGEIDLKSFKYVKSFSFKGAYRDLLFHSGLGFFRGNYIYDSDRYSIHGYYQDGGVTEYRVLDKISGSLKRNSRLDDINRVDGLSYLFIEDSTIYYRDTYGVVDSFGVNSGITIHSKDFLQLYQSKQNNVWIYYLICVIILLICLLIFIKMSKRNLFNSNENSLIHELKIIEKKFKNLNKNVISKEKLDELFGISHYSYETIKTKRSSLIKNLNQQSKIKIERIRKKDDKRFFNYKIS